MARRRMPRRRRRRRRRRMMRRRPVISRGPLFGKYKVAKLRFSQAGQLLSTDTGPPDFDKWIVRSFIANGAGTPSLSNPGAQPEGFGLLAPLFQRVYTLGSRITYTVLPPQTAHSGICWLEKSTQNLDGTLNPELSEILANKYVRYGYYGQGPGNSSKIQKSYTFSTKKWFNCKDVKDNTDLGQDINISGTPLAPPERAAYFNVGWSNTHPSQQGTSNRDFVVVIDFICLFVGPRNVA